MKKRPISRELVFNLYLYLYKEELKKIIEFEGMEIELEKTFYKRRVDLYAESNDEVFFIENQISSADKGHLEEILYIADKCENKINTIIWISKGFSTDIIKKLEEKLKKSKKNVKVELYETNSDFIEKLGHFTNNTKEFDIIDNLYKLKKEFKPKKICTIYSKFYFKDNQKKIIEKILKELRIQLYFMPNVHNQKNLDLKSITLGAGISEIVYTIGVNRKSEIFSSLNFNQDSKEIFYKLLEIQKEVDDKLDYLFEWDLRLKKIYSATEYRDTDTDIDRIIKKQVRILKKLILFFYDYIE